MWVFALELTGAVEEVEEVPTVLIEDVEEEVPLEELLAPPLVIVWRPVVVDCNVDEAADELVPGLLVVEMEELLAVVDTNPVVVSGPGPATNMGERLNHTLMFVTTTPLKKIH